MNLNEKGRKIHGVRPRIARRPRANKFVCFSCELVWISDKKVKLKDTACPRCNGRLDNYHRFASEAWLWKHHSAIKVEKDKPNGKEVIKR